MGLKDTMKSMVAADQQQAAGAVAKQQGGGEVSIIDDAFAPSASSGMEDVRPQDLVIPRLVILQALSPQIDKNKPEYIAGAGIGDFCDVATGEIWKDRVELLMARFSYAYLEWAPRSSGKGLIRNYGTDIEKAHANATQNEQKQWVTKDGNRIVETVNFFALNLTAGGTPCFIPLSSTQIKAGRLLMTKIQREEQTYKGKLMLDKKIYYRSWIASSVSQSNNQGSWMGWKFEPGTRVEDFPADKKHLANLAKSFGEEMAKIGSAAMSFTDDNAGEESDKM